MELESTALDHSAKVALAEKFFSRCMNNLIVREFGFGILANLK